MTRILTAAVAALFLLPGATQAAPYAGIDLNANLLNLNSADPSTYPQSTIGPAIHVGYRFDNLAGELGYSTSRGQQDPDNLRLNMLSADALYYVPVGGFLNLVLTAGGAEVNYGDSTSNSFVYLKGGNTRTYRQGDTIFHGDEFDWRVGGGLSFNITQGYELHFLGRYQPVSMHGLSDYSAGLDFGMNFYF